MCVRSVFFTKPLSFFWIRRCIQIVDKISILCSIGSVSMKSGSTTSDEQRLLLYLLLGSPWISNGVISHVEISITKLMDHQHFILHDDLFRCCGWTSCMNRIKWYQSQRQDQRLVVVWTIHRTNSSKSLTEVSIFLEFKSTKWFRCSQRDRPNLFWFHVYLDLLFGTRELKDQFLMNIFLWCCVLNRKDGFNLSNSSVVRFLV